MSEHFSFEELPFYLELNPSDVVFISSDLKNIALQARNNKKQLDIDLFIQHLKEVVHNGTIVIPAYTDYLKNGETFDYLKSKPSTGALSNKVFKRSDFVRTFDPLHSVFVWGKHTQELLDLHDQSTFGKKSVFGFLHEKNAKFIFIDVHIENSFTFIHYIEEYQIVPYRKYYEMQFECIDSNGNATIKRELFHTKKKGVVTDFTVLQEKLMQTGVMNRVDFQGVFVDVVSAVDTVFVTQNMLKEKKYLYHFDFKLFMKQWLKELFPFLLRFKK